jgi:hypothetical protein
MDRKNAAKTSADLGQWLDPAVIRQMLASNEAQAPEVPMRPFRVIVGPKDAPRLDFTAMAASSTDCYMQHIGLTDGHERLVVLALGERS